MVIKTAKKVNLDHNIGTMVGMDKSRLISYLKDSLNQQIQSALAGVESEAQAVQTLQQQLAVLNYLPLRNWDDSKEVIVASCLVEVEVCSQGVALPVRNWVLMVPAGGAYISSFDGIPVQVLTDLSPLGGSLLGKKKGDQFDFDLAGKRRTYKVVRFS